MTHDVLFEKGLPVALDAEFGRLTVIGPRKTIFKSGRNRHYYLCRCTCGTICEKEYFGLTGGAARSCGCLAREVSSRNGRTTGFKRKHGESCHAGNSAEYRIWAGMKGRCENPTDRAYGDYGGRGITVHPAWSLAYTAFLGDVGRRPSNKHSLDRIDNDKGYCPGNVRWATRQEQSRNTRGNRLVSMRGKTQCVAAWSQELDFPATVIYLRLAKGWNEEKALTWPIRKTKRSRA